VLKKMIDEHMNTQDQSSKNNYKPKRYYQHSSMEFNQDSNEIRGGGYYKHPSQVNGNVQSIRSSGGNLNTHYSSHTPASGSNTGSSTSKINCSNTPYSGTEKRVTKANSNKLSTKEIADEPVGNESFDDTVMDESSMSLGVGDFEEGPAIHKEALHRGLNFTNSKVVLSQNLDEFMDRKLQQVAEKLAEK